MSTENARDSANVPPESQPILVEIRRAFGFIPPALGAMAQDPVALRGAWMITQAGYVQNTLPTLFKERFMTVMAKYNLTPYSLIVRSCSLRQLGMTGQQILEFLRTKLPSQRMITEQIRAWSARWVLRSGWSSMPGELEMWLLWAAARMTVRKDPGGRCRNALRDALSDELYNKVVAISTFAAMQRVWIDAHPDFDAMQDQRVIAAHKALLKETPEFAQVWDSARKRSSTRTPGPRERRLLAEIARQDRIRESLRHSEQRFRNVVQSMPFPVLVYAADGEVILVNRAWTQQSGWRLKDVPTMGDWYRKGEHDQSRWEAADVEVLYDWPQPVEEGEHTIFTASGQTRIWDFFTMSIGKLTDGRHGLMRTAIDVSERHRLQSALWETNGRITQILESIGDAFVAVDKNHVVTWMNQEAARLAARSREAVIGRKAEDAFPDAVGTSLYERLVRCMRDGRTEHFEMATLVAGTALEVHAYGSDNGLTVYLHDITDRKRMEEALRNANEHLGSVLGSITDAFFVLDRTHRITWINQKAANMLHVDRNTVVGKTLEDAGPHNARPDVTRQVIQCMEQCRTLHLEYYSDAIGAHIEMHAYGWKDGVAVHFRDVSQRKKLEEELRERERYFRSIFECSMIGMLVANARTGLVLDANDTFLSTLGYTRQELETGKINWLAATPPQWADITGHGQEKVQKGPLVPYEKEYLHKDGHPVPVMVGGTPLNPEGGEIAIGFVIDRTEAKRAQQQRDELYQMLDAVLQATPVPINVLDLQGRIIMWNDAAVKLFGWTRDEVMGKTIATVLDQDHERYAAILARRVAGESLSLTEIPCPTKDGQQIYVDVHCSPVRDAAGTVIALVTVMNCSFAARQDPSAERWAKQ